MNAKPIPCQYGGGNEYHCDRSPCMICPGPVNQRQGVEAEHTLHPTVDGRMVVMDAGGRTSTREMTDQEMFKHLRHLDHISGRR